MREDRGRTEAPLKKWIGDWLGRRQKSVLCHRINITEKTLLIIRFSGDCLDEEKQRDWVSNFSEHIYEWLGDKGRPILVLGIHGNSGVDIKLEKVEVDTDD